MKILPDPVIFDWDKGNIDKNLKHNVTDKEAEEVFNNKPILILEDEKHSLIEARYMVWGITNKGRKLSIFFTLRGETIRKVRVISARDMHKRERRSYDEKVQKNTKV